MSLILNTKTLKYCNSVRNRSKMSKTVEIPRTCPLSIEIFCSQIKSIAQGNRILGSVDQDDLGMLIVGKMSLQSNSSK